MHLSLGGENGGAQHGEEAAAGAGCIVYVCRCQSELGPPKAHPPSPRRSAPYLLPTLCRTLRGLLRVFFVSAPEVVAKRQTGIGESNGVVLWVEVHGWPRDGGLRAMCHQCTRLQSVHASVVVGRCCSSGAGQDHTRTKITPPRAPGSRTRSSGYEHEMYTCRVGRGATPERRRPAAAWQPATADDLADSCTVAAMHAESDGAVFEFRRVQQLRAQTPIP